MAKQGWVNVCFHLKTGHNSRRLTCRLSAMCGRLRVGKDFLHVCSIGRCSHVFGLLARHTGPLAIMPCADQVPVKSPHSTMHWHMWVVLIAGRPALHYVLFVLPTFTSRRAAGVISFTPRVRRVPCSAHLWPSLPTPFWRSCWRARSRRPWSAAEPAMLRARADAWRRGFWHNG